MRPRAAAGGDRRIADYTKGNPMSYVDGFVIPIPKKNVAAYRKIARKAGKVWMEYGALQYVECVGDELQIKMITATFPKLVKLKPGETVVFSWIRYKSKGQRNRVNAQVMKDPRMDAMIKDGAMPFDMKRMSMGGFKSIVEL
jgi:uncharacterized protein YbaA (DUF1428 family)